MFYYSIKRMSNTEVRNEKGSDFKDRANKFSYKECNIH